MLIVLDMDDVLTQTNQHWVDCYNDDWNENLTMEDVKGWNIHTWVKPECSYSIYEYLKRPGFFRFLEPVEGAIRGLRLLHDAGHDVIIASASPIESPLAIEEKKDWLREYVSWFKLKNFFPIHRKELLRGDVLFDDGTHNLKDFQGISVCMDRPWNRGEDCCEERVSSWSQFLLVVNKLTTDGEYRSLLRSYANARWTNNFFEDTEEEWHHEQH